MDTANNIPPPLSPSQYLYPSESSSPSPSPLHTPYAPHISTIQSHASSYTWSPINTRNANREGSGPPADDSKVQPPTKRFNLIQSNSRHILSDQNASYRSESTNAASGSSTSNSATVTLPANDNQDYAAVSVSAGSPISATIPRKATVRSNSVGAQVSGITINRNPDNKTTCVPRTRNATANIAISPQDNSSLKRRTIDPISGKVQLAIAV